MEKTTLYIVRHGKTMFNTIGRTQGWSDSPLTAAGAATIQRLGTRLAHIDFLAAYSSDSGRAVETMRLLQEERQQPLPYQVDPRLREWCFGSLDGGYDGELWGVLPRILAFQSYEDMMQQKISYRQLAQAISQADTANWAEPYEQIETRVWQGFEAIAQTGVAQGGGNLLVVSHGLTIAFLLNLIDPNLPMQIGLENGSVTKLSYHDGQYTIEAINDLSYLI